MHQKLVRAEGVAGYVGPDGVKAPRVKGELILEAPKWESHREIDLDPDDSLWPVLAAQGMRMREFAKQRGQDEGGDSPWRFLLFRRTPEPGRRGPFGAPWAPDTIGHEFEKACKRVGWPTTRTPHHARHHVASNLLRAGFSTKAVASILGHRTVRTFEETYAHVLREIGYGKRISAALLSLE